jgi:hypothetical protein
MGVHSEGVCSSRYFCFCDSGPKTTTAAGEGRRFTTRGRAYWPAGRNVNG